MTGVIRWEEPPPEHGNKRPAKPSKYQPIADALRGRPGEWAVVVENKAPGSAGNLVWRIKSGVGPFAPPRSFDAKCIGPAGGSSSKVYARYVGTPEAGDD
jgi:hypothetical protein